MPSEIQPDGAAIPMDLFSIVENMRKRVADEEDLVTTAEQSGVKYTTLYQFKTGRRSMPRLDVLQQICDYYGVQITVATHRVPTYQGER